MTDKNKALEHLADAYVARGAAQARVRAKYAAFESELAAAKQEDIDTVAQALVEALDAGASVAAAGRAMGTANIYNSRRAYYNRARELQGQATEDDNELLDRLYRKARGEDEVIKQSKFVERRTEGELIEPDDSNYVDQPYAYADDDIQVLQAWVNSWTLDHVDEDTIMVNDPQGRVESIRKGYINGFQKVNLTEFMKNKELAQMVTDVHGIETRTM